MTMIELTQGNLLEANAEALVNTVNCVGFMGKGIALQFKQAFPDNFKAYERACRLEEVRPGKMFIFDRQSLINPKFIINFPTKRHWKGRSKIEDIESGLMDLIQEIKRLKIGSIAVPPLGCGLGGLDWSQVRPRIETAFSEIPEVRVYLFQPIGSPEANNMPVRTMRPSMTVARALLIKLMEQYRIWDYSLTLLEIQKLAYFLQEAGEPMRLRYTEGRYGPYADNLNKVLERLEGHYIRGYGDSQKPDQEIALLPSASEEAESFLREKEGPLQRLERVAALIEGFETPHGMELLASTHWVAKNKNASSAEQAITAIHSWSERKRKMFVADHILVAWQRLQDEKWLN